MIEKVNSTESLEALLRDLEPQLPLGVRYLGPLLGCKVRYGKFEDGPKDPPPNLTRNHPYGDKGGFSPFIVRIEMFRSIRGRLGGWLYTIHFVLDDLLTAEEVRTKVHTAVDILTAQRGETCSWEAYMEELDQIEREGYPREPLAN